MNTIILINAKCNKCCLFNPKLFNRRKTLSIGQISIQWITQLVSLILIRWIVIYPLNSDFQRLKNPGLLSSTKEYEMLISAALERLEIIGNKIYLKHITTLTSSRRLETHNTQYQQASANETNNNLTALTSNNSATQKNCM